MPQEKQHEQNHAAVQLTQDAIHLISHQLLNSVTKLQMICDMYGDSETPIKQFQEEILPIFRHEIGTLHRLGQNILQLDQTTEDELSVNLEPVDLMALVEQMLISFRLQKRKRKFEGHYELDLPPVWADAKRLQDVLDNLIDNALKYSEPFSPIKISIWRDNFWAGVSITNAGSTIPKNDEKRIFTKFYRNQNNQQSSFGLGLYLADQLIKLHGGRIWVENSPENNTTTFQFTLLLVNQAQLVRIGHNGK